MASMCQLLDDGMVGSCVVGVHGVDKNGERRKRWTTEVLCRDSSYGEVTGGPAQLAVSMQGGVWMIVGKAP